MTSQESSLEAIAEFDFEFAANVDAKQWRVRQLQKSFMAANVVVSGPSPVKRPIAAQNVGKRMTFEPNERASDYYRKDITFCQCIY